MWGFWFIFVKQPNSIPNSYKENRFLSIYSYLLGQLPSQICKYDKYLDGNRSYKFGSGWKIALTTCLFPFPVSTNFDVTFSFLWSVFPVSRIVRTAEPRTGPVPGRDVQQGNVCRLWSLAHLFPRVSGACHSFQSSWYRSPFSSDWITYLGESVFVLDSRW